MSQARSPEWSECSRILPILLKQFRAVLNCFTWVLSKVALQLIYANMPLGNTKLASFGASYCLSCGSTWRVPFSSVTLLVLLPFTGSLTALRSFKFCESYQKNVLMGQANIRVDNADLDDHWKHFLFIIDSSSFVTSCFMFVRWRRGVILPSYEAKYCSFSRDCGFKFKFVAEVELTSYRQGSCARRSFENPPQQKGWHLSSCPCKAWIASRKTCKNVYWQVNIAFEFKAGHLASEDVCPGKRRNSSRSSNEKQEQSGIRLML